MRNFEKNLSSHVTTFEQLRALTPQLESIVATLADCLSNGGKILLCGNGGSAADCQHIAAELTGRLRSDRRPLAALALTTDTSALTCIANDYGFEQVFARQLRALGNPGDCLIGISTSGNSPNVLNAFGVAHDLGVTRVGLLGGNGGSLLAKCDLSLVVPSYHTARIQEAHIFIGHSICEEIEIEMKLLPEDN